MLHPLGMAERICRPNACHCEPAPGQRFCSEHCADRADETGSDCDCGHAECRPERAALYDPSGPGPLRPEDVESG